MASGDAMRASINKDSRGLLEPELEIVAAVSDGRPDREATEMMAPDVIVIDCRTFVSSPTKHVGVFPGKMGRSTHSKTRAAYATMARP
jgi:hypothetical protein